MIALIGWKKINYLLDIIHTLLTNKYYRNSEAIEIEFCNEEH